MTAMSKQQKIVAVDGPSASGKSSVSKRLCEILGYDYFSTGTIYRTMAYLVLDHKIPLAQESQILDLVTSNLNRITWLTSSGVMIDDKCISSYLNSLEISQTASKIATIKSLRDILLPIQRKIGQDAKNGIVMDGRDIGTVVFPEAKAKFFLTASARARAERRHTQLRNEGSLTEDQSISSMIEEIEIRDKRDSERTISPLKKADNAIEVDSTHLTLEEVATQMAKMVREIYE